jgi:hypothetical protein
MNWFQNGKKSIFFMVAGLFVVTGTYNSVVINSESHLSSSEVRFVKRLDEVYGVTVAGREVAAAASWQKLPSPQVIAKKVQPVINSSSSSAPSVAQAPEQIAPAAAVQEELSLTLVEVINPKKWQTGLPAGQFSGNLSTSNGAIEELSVSLPNGEGVSVSFSEMTGNVFEYDLDGELYSGMMYQVDQNVYMVTLTNGPLEGTRMRFSGQAPAEEQPQQDALAENTPEQQSGDIQAQMAQQEAVNPEQVLQLDEQMQQNTIQAQTDLSQQTM